jgi:glycosyltransferase involved in cell wall biosynthesis
MKPAIIIPVYNHPRVVEVIEKIRALGLPIIVVDDGSGAETREALAMTASGNDDFLILLRHPKNQGKGAALLTGFAAALALGHDAALTIDADGQHDPADGAGLLAMAAQ